MPRKGKLSPFFSHARPQSAVGCDFSQGRSCSDVPPRQGLELFFDPRLSQGPPPTSAEPGGAASALGLEPVPGPGCGLGFARASKGETLAVFFPRSVSWLVLADGNRPKADPSTAETWALSSPRASQDADNQGLTPTFGQPKKERKVEGQNFAPQSWPDTGPRQARKLRKLAPFTRSTEAKCWIFLCVWPTGKRKDKLRLRILPCGLAGNSPKADPSTAETWALSPPRASQDADNLGLSHMFGQSGNRTES